LRALAACAVALALGPALALAEPPPQGVAVGAGLGMAAQFRDPEHNIGAGFVIHPRIAYELSNGLAPALAISYGRWLGDGGNPQWELSALGGLRWTILPDAIAPWVEGAIGYGQLVHLEQGTTGRVDIGPRAQLAVGLDYALSPSARLAVYLAGNQLYGGGTPGYVSTWLELGASATFRLF
jgi:hypothetical protein